MCLMSEVPLYNHPDICSTRWKVAFVVGAPPILPKIDRAAIQPPVFAPYRGTSLVRTPPLLGPYSRTI